MKHPLRLLSLALAAAGALVVMGAASAHGDVVPQPVDTGNLKKLGATWLESNPYRGNAEACTFAADAGCTEDVNMGAEWYADQAFASHNASRVCLLVHA